MTGGGGALLDAALAQIRREIDAGFAMALPVPADARLRLVEAMHYAVLGGGKRMRPLLLVATAEMYGVDRSSAVRAGLAVEAIHAYSLIHDDLPCMDNDLERHGKPSVHVAFGETTAVLAGDALQALAFEILADPATSGDPFARIELVQALAAASGWCGMVGGQALDMAAEHEHFDLPSVTRLQNLKTGALLCASVEMGAILARVPAEGRSHLRRYARDIGLAFQIVDDLLDHSGNAALLGKAVGKDAASGKATFVTHLGADRARDQARMLIDQAIEQLANHGTEADLLRAIARFVLERNH